MILHVEDDAVERALFRRQVGLGWEVLQAETLEEAKPLLRRAGLTCVVLDLHLPNGHGRELLDRLRDIRDDVPVVILTGYPGDVAEEFPVSRVLEKPASAEEIVGAIIHAETMSEAIEEIRKATRHLKERRSS